MTEKDASLNSAKKFEEKSKNRDENKWNKNKNKNSILITKTFIQSSSKKTVSTRAVLE